MGYILFLIALSAAITIFTYLITDENKDTTMCSAIITGAVSVVLVILFSSTSYFNTIQVYGQKARIEQRRSAITLYVEHANVPTGAKGKLISDLTDKKYEDYQRTLGGFIDNLNYLVEGYNSTVAQKLALKRGFLFGKLVHCPEDLKIIKMIE